MTKPVLYPLTFPQQSVWDIETFYSDTTYANLVGGVIIQEEINHRLIEKAVNIIIQRHEAIRLRLLLVDGEPRQYVSQYREYKVEKIDFDYSDGLREFDYWKESQTKKPFELFDNDLFYFALIKLNNSKVALYVKFHHLICDLWSHMMIVGEILRTYRELVKGESLIIQSEPSYVSYIIEDIKYRTSPKFQERKMFWQNVFQSVPELTTLDNSSLWKRDRRAKRKTMVISSEICDKINLFSADYKFSGFVIFFSVYALYLSKITHKQDIVIGTPVLNRANYQQRNTAGMFISNIPFRITIDYRWDYLTYLKKIYQSWKNFLKNQRYPYKEILKDIRMRQGYTGKLIDVAFSYHNSKLDTQDMDLDTFWCFNGNEINTLSLSISDWQDEGILILNYDYLFEAFTEAEVEQIHFYIVKLLSAAISDPTKHLAEISLLTGQEKQLLINEHNNTNLDYPKEKTIHQIFEEQANKTPNQTAIIINNTKLTYRELNERANQLARVLRGKGVRTDSIVGIMLKRSPELIIGIFAVLKAGGAYLPIDPQYPIARVEAIIRDSKVSMLLTNPSIKEEKVLIKRLAETLRLEHIDLSKSSLYTGSAVNLLNITRPNDLAYVIYTSGSTGAPKGVMIEHRSVNNLIHALWKVFCFSEQRVIVSLTTVAFDIFVMETLVPLAYGLCVVIANEEEQKIPTLLFDLIKNYDIKMVQATPSKIQSLIKDPNCRDGLAALMNIFIGGEPLPEVVLMKLQIAAPSARIFNMYGPTETTVWAMYKEVTKEDHITIGRPIANTQTYILDKEMEPVPKGVTGEIFIGGDGVARGYLHRPDLTKERFIPNPFQQGTLYKTGDLGRWTAEGEIEYLGRNDDQVKVRGFRIELGEIEKCLLKHQALQEAVVVTHEDGGKRNYLCAYLVGDQTCSALDIRAFLEQRLPDYMIPAKFIWLEAIPLTPNCKVDKQALPDPSTIGTVEDIIHTPPRNEIDAELAGLWTKALDVDRVGIDDNFFLLGGDSLAIIEVLTGIWFRKWDLNAQDFYDYPTVRQLSDKVRGIIKKQRAIELSEKYPHPDYRFNQSAQNSLSALRGNVLLTGATGFLGIHLLWELLNNTAGPIYCLVRGEGAEKRFRSLFKHYFPASAESEANRIKVVNGDISKKQFGMSANEYHDLGQKVSGVINAAGLVKHYGDYQDFMEVNVQGTQELIEFCLTFEIPLNHISTISIAGNQLVDAQESRCFSETELYIGQNYRDNLYIRSKFEAEVCVLKGRELGLKAAIFRVGILTGRYSDGLFQGNINENAFYQKLKSLLTIKAIPEERMSQELEFTPVDFCARGIVNIIRTNTGDGLIFHMLNHKTIKTSQLIEILNILGVEIKLVNIKTFYQLIESSMHRLQSNSLRGLVLDLGEETLNQSSGKIEILSNITQTYLAQTGFEWPDINEGYLRKLLEHMIRVGFLQQII